MFSEEENFLCQQIFCQHIFFVKETSSQVKHWSKNVWSIKKFWLKYFWSKRILAVKKICQKICQKNLWLKKMLGKIIWRKKVL